MAARLSAERSGIRALVELGGDSIAASSAIAAEPVTEIRGDDDTDRQVVLTRWHPGQLSSQADYPT